MKKLTSKRSRKAGLPPGSLVHIGDRIRETTHISVLEYNEFEVHEREIKALSECLPLEPSLSVMWINMDSVHDAEVLKQLGKCFDIHPLVLEDIINTDQRPKIEDYGNHLYIVLKMLSYKSDSTVAEQVSLILGKNYVISFQEQGKPGDVFDPIRIRIRNGAGRTREKGPDFLAYSLLDAIVDHYFIILEKLGDRIELLEDELMARPSSQTVGTIHHLRREMIFLRRSVWPLREVISSLERGKSPLITEPIEIYLRDVYDHTIQVIETVETFRDMLSAMLDIYLSSITYRTNEVMKLLTMIATLFIPLTFIVGVYGMNFEYLPELKWRWSYPILWVIMISIALGMLVYFRRKKWL
jgi:magnesium Mg(2+) and cobalt Co(2+) transport protein (corA)